MMKKFTLFTETKDNLSMLASEIFESVTLQHGVGFWKGQQEGSTAIILFSGDVVGKPYSETLKKVYDLADKIKVINNQ